MSFNTGDLSSMRSDDLAKKRALPAVAPVIGAAFAAGVLSYLYASYVENRRYRLEVVRVDVPRNVNGGYRGHHLRILHLSDLHLAEPESHKVDFIRRVTAMDYDMIVLTGDVFEDYSGLKYADSLLSRKPRFGAYAVLGNHDYYDYTMFHKVIGRLVRRYRHPPVKRSVEPMVKALEAAGFTVLRHDAVTLPEAGLHVVGIDYPGIEFEHLQQLVSQSPPDHLILALLHVPHGLSMLPAAGVDVAFAGHTHGGQVRIPGIGALITDSELPRHEASGLLYRGSTAIHVSRGLGADPKTNFRLFCPPAATVVHVIR